MSKPEAADKFFDRTIFRDETRSDIVKSAQRVLEVLEFFSDFRCEASVSEVSKALDYPQSSTSALLRSLWSLGYLFYNPTNRTFSKTLRVAVLGYGNDEFVCEGPLLKLMSKLADETDETIGLVARNGVLAQYVYVIQGRRPPPCRIGIGHSPTLIASGVGHALLSTMTDAEIRRIATRVNVEAKRPADQIDYRQVLERVATVRRQGYSVMFNGKRGRGGGLVATLLPKVQGASDLAISVFGQDRAIAGKVDAIATRLMEAVSEYRLSIAA